MRVGGRKLLRADGGQGRRLDSEPGSARLARRGVPDDPEAVPRADESGDRLLVVEMVPVPGQPDAGIALLDMAMMMFGGEARQRTEEEYNQLFSTSGFGPARVIGTGTAFRILEAKQI